MSWTVEFVEDLGVVLARTEGKYDAKIGIEMLKEVNPLLREHSTNRLLIDLRLAELQFSVADLFNRPDEYLELGLDRRLRTGLIFRELNENRRFLETVCVNRGYNLKVFEDYDQAVQWVTGSD
ncbi:MAG: hypothetical protein NTW14_09930 [bacterium]|nr:hypothetical protein [bacterium]